MDYQTRPLHSFSMSETAELFNRSFEEYFVPVQFTADSFVTFAQRDGIDFSASQALFAEGKPVGLAAVACRGRTSRIGGFGILREYRGQGAGDWFVKYLLSEARLREEKAVYLEVITQNETAVRLYERNGFVRIRKLLGFQATNPVGCPDDGLQSCDQTLVLELSRGYCLPELPWQLDAETLQTVQSFGYRLGNAFTLISNPSAEHVSFRSLVVPVQARGQGMAVRLIQALFALYPGKTWQVPAIFPEEMGSTFLRAGMQPDALSQWQMVCRL